MLRILIVLCVLCACASNARVSPDNPSELAAGQRERLLETAERFMASARRNDTSAIRGMVDGEQPLEWVANVRHDYPQLLETSAIEFNLVGVYPVSGARRKVVIEFEIPFRRFSDICYASGANDHVQFVFSERKEIWQITTVAMQIC